MELAATVALLTTRGRMQEAGAELEVWQADAIWQVELGPSMVSGEWLQGAVEGL